MDVPSLRLLGFCSLAVALVPICLFLLPMTFLPVYRVFHAPRRYHYYYFAPTEAANNSNSSIIAISGFFVILGIGLLIAGRRIRGGLQPEDEST